MAVLLMRPSGERIEALRRRSERADLTYRPVGATADPELPRGFFHRRASATVGAGEADWSRAKEALVTWQAHRGAGIDVVPPDAPLRPDQVVVSVVPIGPFTVLSPCRIVYTTDEPDRFGFAYGTLPGHPEVGEEAFHVTRRPDGSVGFEIAVYYRAADLLARLSGPAGRLLQKRATDDYVRAVSGFVAGPGRPGTESRPGA